MSKSPLIIGYFPLDDATATVDTDNSGDVDITLPAGQYYAAQYSRVWQTSNMTASADFLPLGTVGSALPAVGEQIEIYDISADDVLATALTVTGQSGSGVFLDANVQAGANDRAYPVGSIQGALEGRMAASDTGAGSDTSYIVTNTDGTFHFLTDSGATISFGNAMLQSIFRVNSANKIAFDDDPSTFASERAFLGFFRPSKAIVLDLPRKARSGKTYVSDAGKFVKLALPQIVRHDLTVRYRGGPRTSSWMEIHDWEDLCDLMDAGYRIRYYPDTSASIAPFARQSNPYGWQEWYVEDGAAFMPRNPVGGVYDHFTQDLKLIEHF